MPDDFGEHSPFHRVSQYYDVLVERFGHDARACDYGRAESQRIKFQVLSEMLDYSGKSVLDVGCGFADFAGYLQERYFGVRYSGIDLSPRMIAQAKSLRPDLDLRVGNLLEADVSGRFDVVVANGIFYLLGDEAPRLMANLVGRMFQIAETAVGFNSLSTWAADQEQGEFYADPMKVLELGRSLARRLVLRHDYHTRDFTVYLYKKPNP
jgi:SAM-dependent methyltransferase